MSSFWRIKAEFTDKRQRRTKKFHDELSSDCRLTDPMLAFKVDVFYRLVDVAINQLELRFAGQRQVAQLFKFLFPDSMLNLSDAELETEARNLQTAYSADLGEDLVSEVRSFRREFREEIKNCESVRDVLSLLLSSDVLSSMPELGAACILFCTLPVTVS